MIQVTLPFSPPIQEYYKHLEGIWQRNWFTNNGPLVKELEESLKKYLGSEHLLFLGNGTIAIQIAIKALGLKGEIITTPFSYVATTSSIVWEGCTPVFADINPTTLNIDPAAIESAITDKTTAILATHVYGNPCDIETIDQIARKHRLKVIYDAAHCFGSKYKGQSVFSFGDVSTTSFHATKLFHTIEGGAVFTNNKEVLQKMSFMRNFGHNGPEDFAEVGINGKNSEFHAAMGLVNLKYVEEILLQRKVLHHLYDIALKGLPVSKPEVDPQGETNYSYYAIVFESEEVLLKVFHYLTGREIFTRRYFYPILSSLPYLNNKNVTPVAEDISRRVLCLPLFHSMTPEQVNHVCQAIMEGLK
jgi:dTDP-4-amino-4,6-dideoxygalactose transaminase